MARQKQAAAIAVCQSKDEVMQHITALGDKQRELTRVETEINDQIAVVNDKYKDKVSALKEQITVISTAVQGWCEANRAALCKGGKKTANLITGEVSWRVRPPSVSVRQIDKVLETLKKLGLNKFIRSKEEINKDAILAEPLAVAGIAGVTINSGVEDFVITPFEVSVQ